jgi:hypothetical protein
MGLEELQYLPKKLQYPEHNIWVDAVSIRKQQGINSEGIDPPLT